MVQATRTGFQFDRCGWALSAPILLFALIPAAWSQCSQSKLPGLASPAPSATSADGSPSAAAGADSSSSSSPVVRFGTGTAITVLEGTPLRVINDFPISSRTTKAGAKLSFTVTRDVIVDGMLVVPCGAMVIGTVVEAKQAGRLVGASNLTLQWTALNLDGRSYPLYTPPFKVVGQSKTAPTVKKMSIGAAAGTLFSEATLPAPKRVMISDGGPTRVENEEITATQRAEIDAINAGVGAGVGAAIAASSPPSIALIPAESEMEFTLASPIAVYPVDQRTAVRLARGMRQGGPVLYVRGESQ